MNGVPADLAAALDAVPGEREAFEALAPSHRREYLAWIDEARRAETRERRIRGTVERVSGGAPGE